MQICQDHWHELRNAIRQRGLWELVASGTPPTLQVTGQEAEPPQEMLDPLRTTSLMISDQAVMAFGSYLLTRNDCPLCEVEYNLGKGTSLEWIDVDADIVLVLCKERHLIRNEE